MHKLTQPKAFKIVFDASIEGFQKLLCVKQQLGEDFYVRNDGTLTRFIVGFSEKHLSKLSPEYVNRAIPMTDDGVERPCVPLLYRFLEENFIDDFLRDGALRLSTFAKCAGLEDQRADKSEGSVKFYSASGLTASAKIGMNAYVLCTSLTPYAANPKKCSHCLLIQEPTKFARAITAGLRAKGVAVAAVTHGPCFYTDHNIFFTDDMPHTDETLQALVNAFDDKLYFMKDATPEYLNEHEYRFLWLADNYIENEYIDIHIDNPTEYAMKLKVPVSVPTTVRS